MKPKILLRLAAGCLLFFAMGHSIGHFSRHETATPEQEELVRHMVNYRFDFFGTETSYDLQYAGMSLNLLFTLIAMACILFFVSSYSGPENSMVRKIVFVLGFCAAAFSATSFICFFVVPGITCTVAALLIIIAGLRIRPLQEA